MTDNIKEKNRFYARCSSVANLQVTNVRVNIVLGKEKNINEKAGLLLCSSYVYYFVFLTGPVMCKFNVGYTYA